MRLYRYQLPQHWADGWVMAADAVAAHRLVRADLGSAVDAAMLDALRLYEWPLTQEGILPPEYVAGGIVSPSPLDLADAARRLGVATEQTGGALAGFFDGAIRYQVASSLVNEPDPGARDAAARAIVQNIKQEMRRQGLLKAVQ